MTLLHRRLLAARASRRGSTLMIAVIVILVVSFTLTTMSATLIDNARITDRKRHSMKALQGAEAGIARVLDFFSRPEQWMTDTTFGTNPFVGNPDDIDDYEPLSTVLAAGDIVIPEELYPLIVVGEGNDPDTAEAVITDLRLMAPPAGAPARSLGMIRSTAVSSQYGIERTVEAIIRPPLAFSVVAPAAIVSHRTIATGGNIMVYWGEYWAAGDVAFMNEQNGGKYNQGPTQAVRTKGRITGLGGGQLSQTQNTAASSTIQDVAPYFSRQAIRNQFMGRLYQNQTDLELPEYDYQTLKDVARQFGHYYSRDAAGNIYRGDVQSDATRITMEEIMSNDPADPAKIVFVDTIDGNPPAADGSNLGSEISIQGAGAADGQPRYMRGLYYVAANVRFTGQGSDGVSLSLPVPDRPDDWVSSVSWPSGYAQQTCISDGVVVFAGNLQVNGQPVFYGSLVAYGQITGSGTPWVYYNPKLAEGLDFPLLSRVEAFQWRIVK